MPLDPQAKQVMEQLAALSFPPPHTVTPEQARLNAKARPRAAGPEVARVEQRSIPGPGLAIPVRIYTPARTGPFPILMWFHGGGWVVGDLDMADATARHLAVGASCVVVSVDYRLAPETKFPGAADDCYAATQWATQHAAEINGDPHRIAVQCTTTEDGWSARQMNCEPHDLSRRIILRIKRCEGGCVHQRHCVALV